MESITTGNEKQAIFDLVDSVTVPLELEGEDSFFAFGAEYYPYFNSLNEEKRKVVAFLEKFDTPTAAYALAAFYRWVDKKKYLQYMEKAYKEYPKEVMDTLTKDCYLYPEEYPFTGIKPLTMPEMIRNAWATTSRTHRLVSIVDEMYDNKYDLILFLTEYYLEKEGLL